MILTKLAEAHDSPSLLRHQAVVPHVSFRDSDQLPFFLVTKYGVSIVEIIYHATFDRICACHLYGISNDHAAEKHIVGFIWRSRKRVFGARCVEKSVQIRVIAIISIPDAILIIFAAILSEVN